MEVADGDASLSLGIRLCSHPVRPDRACLRILALLRGLTARRTSLPGLRLRLGASQHAVCGVSAVAGNYPAAAILVFNCGA